MTLGLQTTPVLRIIRSTELSISLLFALFDSISQISTTPPTGTPGGTLQSTGVPARSPKSQEGTFKSPPATPGPEPRVCFLTLPIVDSTIGWLAGFGLRQYNLLEYVVHAIYTAERFWVSTLFDSALQRQLTKCAACLCYRVTNHSDSPSSTSKRSSSAKSRRSEK